DIAVRGQGVDPVLIGVALHDIDRVSADRAGRAEDSHPSRTLGLGARMSLDPCLGHSHVSTLLPIRRLIPATAAATAIKPSTRSRAPPWPGIILLASLTPKCRLNADSARSPACSIIASPALTAVNAPMVGRSSSRAVTAPTIPAETTAPNR